LQGVAPLACRRAREQAGATVRAAALISFLVPALVLAGSAPARGPSGPPAARVVDCAGRSIGTFRGVVGSPDSVRLGPLWLAFGGRAAARATPETLRDLGWWKMPALVRPGHTVTLRIAPSHRRLAGWTYGPSAGAARRGVPAALRHTVDTIALRACPPGVRPRDSTADGRRVTFWSGGIIFVRAPLCVPIEVWADDAHRPRRAILSLGAGRCR
jgi:hypothetical protein